MERCTDCGVTLDSEESENPRKDKGGKVMCDHCFESKYGHRCPVCGEIFYEDFSEKISPKYLLVSEPVGENLGFAPGIYEIIEYPFYADGMIEMHLFEGAINKVLDFLDDIDEDCLVCSLYYVCEECVKKLSKRGNGNGFKE